MIQSTIITRAALLSVLTACVLTASGCGGAKTNGDSLDTTTAAGPVVVGVDPIYGGEVSGLVTPADATQPTTGDVAYATTASAITVLSGSPPLDGAPTYLGTADYEDGTSNTTAVLVGTTVQFRAYIVNGQAAGSRSYIPIKSAVLTSTDPEAVAAGFTPKPVALAFRADSTASGPLASATFATATFPLPFTTSGFHTFSVTVTDNDGQSSRTDFTTPVVTATDVAFRLGTIDTGTTDSTGAEVIYTLMEGDKAVLAGPSTYQGTADANGIVSLFVMAGTYSLQVTTLATSTTPSATYTQVLDLTGAGGTTVSQAKKRASVKIRPAVKLRAAVKVHR